MKEINLAAKLIEKRREAGITQEELAFYLGVSKASVSKWETGASYPDITFLPQLAAYFNITLDELMGYSPQMKKEDIRLLYFRLAQDFTNQPHEVVMAECRQVVKKYYSCFPLLYYMAVLMINHHMLTATPEEGQAILEEAIHLCRRIQEEGQDVQLANEAACLEAACRLMLRQPEKVLDILGEDFPPISQGTEILPQAYQMMGKTEKAKEILQTTQYQHLLALVCGSLNWMVLEADRPKQADEILRRTLKLVELFEMDTLVPHIAMQVHYAAAQKYARSGDMETALSRLELSVENLEYLGRSPYLHANEYFDKLEEWFQTFDLGTKAPRSLKIIMESVEQAFLADPVLEPLRETPHFRQMMTRIKQSGKEG